MGEDGARGKDWLRARGHHLCLTDTIFYFSFKLLEFNNTEEINTETKLGIRVVTLISKQLS